MGSTERDYAHTLSDEWKIISAKFAVVPPDGPLPYYDETVTDLEGEPVRSNRSLPGGGPVETRLDAWAVRILNGLAARVDLYSDSTPTSKSFLGENIATCKKNGLFSNTWTQTTRHD